MLTPNTPVKIIIVILNSKSQIANPKQVLNPNPERPPHPFPLPPGERERVRGFEILNFGIT
jgi:hypothetical protein